MHARLWFSALLLGLAGPAMAGEGADTLTRHLYAGTLAEGIEALAPLAAAGDEEAVFGTGLLKFVGSLETFAQQLHRYGVATPGAEGGLSPFLIPVPANPTPEAMSYEAFRTMLSDFVIDLDAARDALLAAEQGSYVVPVDLLQVRMDLDADGAAEADESIGALFAAAVGTQLRPGLAPGAPPRPVEPPPGPAEAKRQNKGGAAASPTPEAAAEAPAMLIGFDRADAIWLAGYSQVLAAQFDFFLAHDFSEFYAVAFHRLFPNASLPMQDHVTGGQLALDPNTDAMIADAVAAVHTINWLVIDRERFGRVLDRARAVIGLSRRNWEAILAETDDEHELLPSPRQTPPAPEGRITQEMVASWQQTLDLAEQVLDGELLLPHWRFERGFDLKAYFDTATRTDLVMLLTGAGALPFLKDGPKADAATFAAANDAFGGNLLGFAFWFN